MGRFLVGSGVSLLIGVFLASCSGVSPANPPASSGSASSRNDETAPPEDLASSLQSEMEKTQSEVRARAEKCKAIITGADSFYENNIIVSRGGYVDFASIVLKRVDEFDPRSVPAKMECELKPLLGLRRQQMDAAHNPVIPLMQRDDIDSRPIPVNRPVVVKGVCAKEVSGVERDEVFKDYRIVQFVVRPGKVMVLSKTRKSPTCEFGRVYVDEYPLWYRNDEMMRNMGLIKNLPVCKVESSTGQEKEICVGGSKTGSALDFIPELVGIVNLPGKAGSAIFQVGSDSVNAGIGDRIGCTDWRLASTGQDSAVIEKEGEQRRLTISSGFAAPQSTKAAGSPPSCWK